MTSPTLVPPPLSADARIASPPTALPVVDAAVSEDAASARAAVLTEVNNRLKATIAVLRSNNIFLPNSLYRIVISDDAKRRLLR
jgi:hypothetical protein